MLENSNSNSNKNNKHTGQDQPTQADSQAVAGANAIAKFAEELFQDKDRSNNYPVFSPPRLTQADLKKDETRTDFTPGEQQTAKFLSDHYDLFSKMDGGSKSITRADVTLWNKAFNPNVWLPITPSIEGVAAGIGAGAYVGANITVDGMALNAAGISAAIAAGDGALSAVAFICGVPAAIGGAAAFAAVGAAMNFYELQRHTPAALATAPDILKSKISGLKD
jgi:hypothetical protein